MPFFLGLLSGALLIGLGELVRTQLAARRRPVLSLDVEPGLAPDRLAHPVAYARLAVHNAPGKDAAVGVSARIDRARAASGDDRDGKLAFLAGRPLAWSGADRGDQNVRPGFTSIAPGNRQLLDLAHLN